jgi:hypothetical protein
MDNISSYNSDIYSLKNNIIKNNKALNELGDKNKILKIKNYDGINQEISELLYREKIMFSITALVAISFSIVTFKTI